VAIKTPSFFAPFFSIDHGIAKAKLLIDNTKRSWGAPMLRTIFWTMMFFLASSMVALQPACHDFSYHSLGDNHA